MFESVISAAMTLPEFLICMFTAIALGVLTALVFTFCGHHSGSWIQSLALLPPVVTLVIMMVNGNIGAGLAVAGTFALVRFRSVPGSAKEIAGLFMAVAVGLACGMGYAGYAALFFLIMALLIVVLDRLHFGEVNNLNRQLKIVIPENLDYEGLFDDLFAKYTLSHELIRVRTTNMGTLYELSYHIRLRDVRQSKAFMDDIRCRNGNLDVICGKEADKDLM